MRTDKSSKLVQCINLLINVAYALEDIDECENSEVLDFVIGDLKQTLAIEENHGTQLISFKDGKFICEKLIN